MKKGNFCRMKNSIKLWLLSILISQRFHLSFSNFDLMQFPLKKMETGVTTININADISFDQTSLDHPFASPTIECIDFIHNFSRLNIDESDGPITSTWFYNGPPTSLKLFSREFSVYHLFRLIDQHLNDPLLSHQIAETMVDRAIQNLGRHPCRLSHEC